MLYDKKQGTNVVIWCERIVQIPLSVGKFLLMGVFTEKSSAINKPSPLHDCCDVCEHKCVCDECNVSILNIQEKEIQAILTQPQNQMLIDLPKDWNLTFVTSW